MSLLKFIANPFEKIAGARALALGLLVLLLAATACHYSGFLFDALLHIGYAGQLHWAVNLLAQGFIWLVPATFFLVAGVILSTSKIRPIDVYGTTALAQAPLLVSLLCAWAVLHNQPLTTDDLMNISFLQILGLLASLVFFALAVFWMFKAFKTSCNLKGAKLWGGFLTGLIGGDIALRFIIPALVISGMSLLSTEAAASKENTAFDARACGSFEGVIQIPGQPLRLRILVKEVRGSHAITIVSPDQSPAEIPASEFSLKNGRLELKVAALGLSYKGKFDAKFDSLDGTFQQGAFHTNLKLERMRAHCKNPDGAAVIAKTPETEKLASTYEGVLNFPGQKLRFRLLFKPCEKGYAVYSASPDQGGGEMAVAECSLENSALEFSMPALNVSFKGSLKKDFSEIGGSFRQGAHKLPLTLKKQDI